MEEVDYKSIFSPMHTPVLINLQGATAKPLSPEWLICHTENFPKIINSIVKANWTHNNKPFLDTPGWPCKNKGKCLPLYGENNYKCICKGFKGKNGENGKKHSHNISLDRLSEVPYHV